MPRLLSINNYHYLRGGAEAVFFDEMRKIKDCGWDVACFSMKHDQNEPSPWDEYFVDEIEFSRSYPLPELLIKAAKSVYSFEARRKLDLLLERFRPDIAHLHNIYHHLSPSILSLLRQVDIPVVLTLHDLKIACPAYKMLSHDGVCERCKGGNYRHLVKNRCLKGSLALSLLGWFEAHIHSVLKSYAKNVDRFIAPSRFYYRKVIEWGLDPAQVTYIPNTVNVNRFQPRAEAGSRYLYAGRLSEEKGIKTLIAAARTSGVGITIAGTGPEEDALIRYANQVAADVEFTGFLRSEKLHKLMQQARALIVPSEWYENAPISILEAYALGIPVIGASIGGIPEMIESNVTGATFESGNSDSLAEVLAQFESLSNNRLLEMGRLARHRLDTQYDSHAHTSSLMDLYATLRSSYS